jgi:cleavage stimulation factor subunit 3
MLDLFPDESPANLFSHRYEGVSMQNDPFDPTKVRPIISLVAQARPKAIPSIEQPFPSDSPARPFSPQIANSPRLGNLMSDARGHFSPKRPLPAELAEDLSQPRKMARGESPLRGAAGRRLDAAKRRNEGSQQHAQVSAPALPRDITFFLSILPRANVSTGLPRINPQALMHALRYMNPQAAQGATMQRQHSGQRHYNYQGR